jgi:hypothetical protein
MPSLRGTPQRAVTPRLAKKERATPEAATAMAAPPTRISSEARIFRPIANSRNITPQIGEDLQDLVGGHPTEQVRTDQDASQNFSDDAGLA